MRTTGKRRPGIAAGRPPIVMAAVAIAAIIAVPTARAQSMSQSPTQTPTQTPTQALSSGATPSLLGQGPEQPRASDPFGRAPRSPIQLWDTYDYLMTSNRTREAQKYLEQFRRVPPMDLWGSADYLVRRSQAPKALPYLDQFLKSQPDDATYIAVRDRYGLDSFRRLDDHPSTRPYAQMLLDALTRAEQRTRQPSQAPGPELFARDPKTPMELWDAIDYLTRTGQSRKAVPYLQRFQKANPDDAAYAAIRDRFGVGSFLRLDDDPSTRPFARSLGEAMAAATRRYAIQPDRVAEFIADLTRTPAEQDYAMRRLREAGAYAVPPLVRALNQPGLPREDHDLLLRNVGRLQPSAVMPLAAVLEGTIPSLAADAAVALGSIGDPDAVPFLVFPAASPASPPAVRSAAQVAIARLTRRPYADQPRTPVRTLADAAWAYHRARPELPEDTAVLWTWDDANKVPAPKEVTPEEARTELGLHMARQALQLDPKDQSAQAAQLSLALDRAARRAGPDAVATQDAATFNAAVAAGPGLLARVLDTAIADGKNDLAAVAVLALAKVTNRAELSTPNGHPHALVRALSAPGRRTQFAAARALVALAPDRPFPGSSLVAPALARFAVNQSLPRAIVIDGNASRASLLTGALNSLGYFATGERTGDLGFLAASGSADVELVLVAYDLHAGNWKLTDTLANLQADARTRGIPVFLYGPHDLEITRPNLARDFPGIRFIVPTDDPALLERLHNGRPSLLTPAERTGYAREATALLARIATTRGNPMAEDLRHVEPALATALLVPDTARPAALALAELPDPSAQRSLLDVALDPSRSASLRIESARLVVASVRRFRPLLAREQEARLIAEIPEETDPAVRSALSAVVAALKR
ncbi:MAG: HEAT repeat domain-containing protein [Isosphaeraceae bacterium]